MARQYISESQLTDADFEKTYLVYKFVETPIQAMQVGLKEMMDSEVAKSYFKKLAKKLHPDKNNHPMAKDAFQKLNMAVDLVRKEWTAT